MSFKDWPEVIFDELIETISETQKHRIEKMVLINTSDVYDGKILNHKYVDTADIPGQFKKKFQFGDILYSEIRPANKRYAFVDFDSEDYIASTKLMVLRCKNDLVNNRFLFHVLKSSNVINELQTIAESRSGTFPQITFSELARLKIKLPKLAEQIKIAKMLDGIDNKIELNNKINKSLEKKAQAIYKSWFVDFEPFKESEFFYSEIGQIPGNWQVVSLSEIATVQNGYAFKSNDYVENGCKMIRTTNITSEGWVDNNDLVNLPINFLSDPKYKNFRFETFDTVLVMVGASIGKIGLITAKNIPALQNQNMWRFRPTKEIDSPIYVHYLVKQINEKVKNWSSGSAREFYRKDSFKNAKCLLPPKEVLSEFKIITNPIYNLISTNLLEIQNLTELRQALQPKLMSGEIQVPHEEVTYAEVR